MFPNKEINSMKMIKILIGNKLMGVMAKSYNQIVSGVTKKCL